MSESIIYIYDVDNPSIPAPFKAFRNATFVSTTFLPLLSICLSKDSPKVLTTSLIVDFVLLCNVLLTYGTTSNAISITVANMLIYTRDAILATIDLDFFIPDFCFLFSTTFFSVGFSFVFVNDSVFFFTLFSFNVIFKIFFMIIPSVYTFSHGRHHEYRAYNNAFHLNNFIL